MRRICLLLPLLLMFATSHALKIIATQDPLIEATPYLKGDPEGSSIESLEDRSWQPVGDLRLPVSSRISEGPVSRKKALASSFSYPLFVVGDDKVSRTWLRENAGLLKTMGAVAFFFIKRQAPYFGLMQLFFR